MKKPATLQELFQFYYSEFKPLYNRVSADGTPPIELLFEVTAAFDHLSRHWQFGDSEEQTVGATSAHLKRGTFDAFKLILVQTKDHYEELVKLDTSIIDNGDFDKRLAQLWVQIRDKAIIARTAEGDTRKPEDWHRVFELWQEVAVDCHHFESEYYLNNNVEWAKKKFLWKKFKEYFIGFSLGVCASILASLLYEWMK